MPGLIVPAPFLNRFELRLADNWKSLHTRGIVIWTGTLGGISALGPILRDAWHSMPDDLKALILANVQQAIAYTTLFTTIIGVRYTSVRRVPTPGDAHEPR